MTAFVLRRYLCIFLLQRQRTSENYVFIDSSELRKVLFACIKYSNSQNVDPAGKKIVKRLQVFIYSRIHKSTSVDTSRYTHPSHTHTFPTVRREERNVVPNFSARPEKIGKRIYIYIYIYTQCNPAIPH